MNAPSIVRAALWACDLRRPVVALEPHGYETGETHDEAALAAAMEVDEAIVRGRLQRGCRAVVARSGGRIAGWTWVSTGHEWAPPIRRELRFAAADCYGWDAGVTPGHRGNGLFAALLECAGRQMAAEGMAFMWGGILDGNLASRRSCVAAGFRPILHLHALHVGRRSALRTRPVEYAEAVVVERARRVLR